MHLPSSSKYGTFLECLAPFSPAAYYIDVTQNKLTG